MAKLGEEQVGNLLHGYFASAIKSEMHENGKRGDPAPCGVLKTYALKCETVCGFSAGSQQESPNRGEIRDCVTEKLLKQNWSQSPPSFFPRNSRTLQHAKAAGGA